MRAYVNSHNSQTMVIIEIYIERTRLRHNDMELDTKRAKMSLGTTHWWSEDYIYVKTQNVSQSASSD